MPNGSRCHSPALKGMPYCYFHQRLHRLAAGHSRAPEEPITLPFMEDRSAVQIALAQVLNALGSARLDPRRAGLLLYGLQIAAQNVKQNHALLPAASVHSITHSSDGEELAAGGRWSANLPKIAPPAMSAIPAKTTTKTMTMTKTKTMIEK